MISARLRGRLALAGAGASVLIMALVASAGTSAAEPTIGSPTLLPPWFLPLNPRDSYVTVALWTAVVTGTVAVLVGLSAVRDGWRPSLRRVIAGGVLATAALLVVPPVGSTDLMDYATYGRMTTLGYSPYRMTPLELREKGDPVAAKSSKSWRRYRSVYGPLGTAEEWAASMLGGSSAARTVWWLKVANALGFLGTALALDRLVGRDRRRRTRVHMLWTLNPLMLWAVIGGGHIDGPAMALAVGGLCALRSAAVKRRPLLAGFMGGLLLGASAAVKAPFALIAAAPMWTWRRSPKVLAAGAVGVFLAVVPGYLLIGGSAIRSLRRRSGHLSEMSPWHLIVKPFGFIPNEQLISMGALLLAGVLAIIFIWGLPAVPAESPDATGIRVALAFSLAWVMASQVYFPWYEVMVLPLLALLPASRADGLLILRAGIAAIGSLPGTARRFHPAWVNYAVNEFLAVAVPLSLLVLSLVLVAFAVRRSWGGDPPVTVRERTPTPSLAEPVAP